MVDWNVQLLANGRRARERRVRARNGENLPVVDELETSVFLERAWQQASLGQHLKAIADTNDGHPLVGCFGDRTHDRREPGDGTGTQVVAMCEPARNDHRIDIADRVIAVPQDFSLAAERVDCLDRIELAIGTRKADDADFGCH